MVVLMSMVMTRVLWSECGHQIVCQFLWRHAFSDRVGTRNVPNGKWKLYQSWVNVCECFKVLVICDGFMLWTNIQGT